MNKRKTIYYIVNRPKLSDEEIDKQESVLLWALSDCQSYLENNRIYLPVELIIELQDISYKSADLLELLLATKYFPNMSEENFARFARNASKYEGRSLKIKLPKRKRNFHLDYVDQIRVELDKLSEQIEKLYKSLA